MSMLAGLGLGSPLPEPPPPPVAKTQESGRSKKPPKSRRTPRRPIPENTVPRRISGYRSITTMLSFVQREDSAKPTPAPPIVKENRPRLRILNALANLAVYEHGAVSVMLKEPPTPEGSTEVIFSASSQDRELIFKSEQGSEAEDGDKKNKGKQREDCGNDEQGSEAKDSGDKDTKGKQPEDCSADNANPEDDDSPANIDVVEYIFSQNPRRDDHNEVTRTPFSIPVFNGSDATDATTNRATNLTAASDVPSNSNTTFNGANGPNAASGEPGNSNATSDGPNNSNAASSGPSGSSATSDGSNNSNAASDGANNLAAHPVKELQTYLDIGW